ncbi:MAG: hypothetical protein ACE5J4_00185 [Candidatus Aenigmatarchaeota archaeon]
MNYLTELIKLGFLVEPNAAELLKNLNQGEFEKLLENLKKEESLVLSEKFIKKIFKKEIKIIKTFIPIKKLSIQDFVNMLNNRYNFLQNILVNKLAMENIISINKVSSGNTTIIGMVKIRQEKNNNLIVWLEDQTGEIETIIPKMLGEKINLDDVIAITGNISNKKLYGEKIIFPDIPIRRVNYSDDSIKIAFILNGKDYDADYLIYENKIKDKLNNKILEITNPSIVSIGGIIILIAHKFEPFEILKKRYIHKDKTDFLIDNVPDILFTDRKINTNYKGVTIVSGNNLINLKTREVISLE